MWQECAADVSQFGWYLFIIYYPHAFLLLHCFPCNVYVWLVLLFRSIRLECDVGGILRPPELGHQGAVNHYGRGNEMCRLSSNLVSSLPPGSVWSHQDRVIELGVGKGHGQLTPCRVQHCIVWSRCVICSFLLNELLLAYVNFS